MNRDDIPHRVLFFLQKNIAGLDVAVCYPNAHQPTKPSQHVQTETEHQQHGEITRGLQVLVKISLVYFGDNTTRFMGVTDQGDNIWMEGSRPHDCHLLHNRVHVFVL
eukprot:Lithocolla_globosa_v1_NODE_2814_length_1860_cov_5.304709.p2 type:complete len:107 gc:universal NODE_2814_length_1860_cov_5.304709:425-745(+)